MEYGSGSFDAVICVGTFIWVNVYNAASPARAVAVATVRSCFDDSPVEIFQRVDQCAHGVFTLGTFDCCDLCGHVHLGSRVRAASPARAVVVATVRSCFLRQETTFTN